MTSDDAATGIGAVAVAPAPLLWITGLSGVGKSTLAHAFAQRLAARGIPIRTIDGDALREHDPVALRDRHDPVQRKRRAWRIAQLAHAEAARGSAVVVATISLWHEVQRWNRRSNARYAEVLLEAPLALLRTRQPALYGSDACAPPPHVWGLDLAPEYPATPELRLPQDFSATSLAFQLERVQALWLRLQARDGAAA
jgi:adenylylsulfate kinase-like enzyme